MLRTAEVTNTAIRRSTSAQSGDSALASMTAMVLKSLPLAFGQADGDMVDPAGGGPGR